VPRSLRRSRTALVGLAAGALVASLGLVGPTMSAASAASGSADRTHKACRNGYVGLTYDDGPSATFPQLFAALQQAGLRATFFNQGNNALTRPEDVRAELAAGMWVGNHTYDHPNLPQIGEPQSFMEIASTQEVLRGISGRVPTLFRPPYGATSEQVRADEQRLGLLEVLWTVDSRDWAGASVDEIVAAVDTLQPGGIILMHDWPANTILAVPRIAALLAAKGLCAGMIAYTAQDISGAGTTFHAIAVKPRRHQHTHG
jgi:peptidoglycan/xylan/chitin deacetylase (PgdA/CDA1 family)